ncbi:MAG: MFS transporter, partial [Actinomycetes bacterium]
LDMRLFANPEFSGAVGSNLISVFSLVGVYFFLAQQFQFVAGDSPLQAGFWLLPGELAALFGSLLVTKVVLIGGRRLAIGRGITLGAVGMLMVGLVQLSVTTVLVTGMVLVGLGFGMSLTGTSDAILAAAPPERAGAASAVSETAYELGSALGIAVLGTIAGLYYRQHVVVPTGLPTDAQQATADSLTAAIEAAQGLPAAVGDAMVSAAQIAYANAFGVACLVAAVIAAVGAVVAFRVLPSKSGESAEVGH